MSDMPADQIAHRFTVLTWTIGVAVALTVATLGIVVNQSHQLGQIAGQLAVLTAHVQLK